MLGLKNKDLVMIGVIIGIALLFIGAIINNVFPSSTEEMIGYKVSSFLKMMGLGFLTCSMIIGGIIVDDIDKNLKILLLIFGLIILLIYSVGSEQLKWDIGSNLVSDNTSLEEASYEYRPTGYGTPGFELIFAVFAIISVFIFWKIIKKT